MGRRWTVVLGLFGVVALLVRAGSPVGPLRKAARDPFGWAQRVGVDAAAGTVVTALCWAVLCWVAAGAVLTALGTLPGIVGDLADLAAASILPAAVRRAVAGVLGLSLTAGLGACAGRTDAKVGRPPPVSSLAAASAVTPAHLAAPSGTANVDRQLAPTHLPASERRPVTASGVDWPFGGADHRTRGDRMAERSADDRPVNVGRIPVNRAAGRPDVDWPLGRRRSGDRAADRPVGDRHADATAEARPVGRAMAGPGVDWPLGGSEGTVRNGRPPDGTAVDWPLGEAGDEGPTASGRGGRAADVVVVRPGDCIWLIAARRLGPTATTGDIAAESGRWYGANAPVVGPDPDLIRPGQVLIAPTATARPRVPP